MATQQELHSYVVLHVESDCFDRYVHSYHLDEAAAQTRIDEVNAMPFVVADLRWTMEVRCTREIRELVDALDARIEAAEVQTAR